MLSSVTAPVNAIALPVTLAPVVRVTLARAIMMPRKRVPVPTVAELPTFQKTWHTLPPLIRPTLALLAVVSVLAILKTKTALSLPWKSRVRFPVN